MHQTSLGSVQAAKGCVNGGVRRRRRRGGTRPWRLSTSPIVLGAGQACFGYSRASQTRSLRGPSVAEASGADQQIGHPGIERLWTVDRPMRSILERPHIAVLAVLEVAREPLVASGSADAESSTERGHARISCAPSRDELQALLHRTGLLPRHRCSSCAASVPTLDNDIAAIYTHKSMSSGAQLPLFRWRGGPRPGAGRKAGPNPRVRHRSRGELSGREPCHVTLKVRPGLWTLRDVRIVRALEDEFRALLRRAGFRIFVYSIQGDHLHLVVEADDERALASGMKAVGTRVARVVNRILKRTGPVLRDRYHLRVLRTPLEVRRALAYVLMNARKHLGGRAARVGRVDPASSGTWFTGWREGVVALALSPAPVARAVTWLLRVGWRRHGLLDPSEVPGCGTA